MGLGLRNDIKMLAWISRHWETSRGRVWGQFGRQRLEAMPPCPDEAKVTQGCGRWAPVLFSKSGHPECPDWQIKVSSSGPSSSVCSQPEPQSECLLAASHSARSCTQTDPRDPHSHWLRSYFYYCCFCYPSLQWWQLRFPESPGFTLLEDVRAESRSTSYDLFPFPGLAYPFSGSQGPHPTLLVAPGLYLVLTQFWPLSGHTHPTSSGIQTKPCRSHLAEMWQTREAALDTWAGRNLGWSLSHSHSLPTLAHHR